MLGGGGGGGGGWGGEKALGTIKDKRYQANIGAVKARRGCKHGLKPTGRR